MKTVVLVDDDPDVQEAVRMVLEKEGYLFRGAIDRKSGMELITNIKPDLIILDVMMEQPDDGFVMAQELRSKNIKTPVIMLTSVSSVTGLKYGKDTEMLAVDDFEEKPISSEKLLRKIESLLAGGA